MKGKEIKMVSAGCGFSLFASNSKLYGSGLNNFYQIGGPLRGKGFEGAHDWYHVLFCFQNYFHSILGTIKDDLFLCPRMQAKSSVSLPDDCIQ
jgi:hypothetical protein